MKKSCSYIAIPPGVTINEQLTDKGIGQKEFAIKMGMSVLVQLRGNISGRC